MGMLAVGLSAKNVQSYLDAVGGREDVAIACYNSTTSVTLSGPSASLTELVETIKADGHFARILQVDVAYHSQHMSEIASYYENLLIKYGGLDDDNGEDSDSPQHMVSSVTEEVLVRRDACERSVLEGEHDVACAVPWSMQEDTQ